MNTPVTDPYGNPIWVREGVLKSIAIVDINSHISVDIDRVPELTKILIQLHKEIKEK